MESTSCTQYRRCRYSRRRRRTSRCDDAIAQNFHDAFLQADDEVAQALPTPGVMVWMHSVLSFEAGSPFTLENLPRPHHITQPTVVERMTRDGLVVRRLHHRGSTPLPEHHDDAFVRIVVMRRQRETRSQIVIHYQRGGGGIRIPLDPEIQRDDALAYRQRKASKAATGRSSTLSRLCSLPFTQKSLSLPKRSTNGRNPRFSTKS